MSAIKHKAALHTTPRHEENDRKVACKAIVMNYDLQIYILGTNDKAGAKKEQGHNYKDVHTQTYYPPIISPVSPMW